MEPKSRFTTSELVQAGTPKDTSLTSIQPSKKPPGYFSERTFAVSGWEGPFLSWACSKTFGRDVLF